MKLRQMIIVLAKPRTKGVIKRKFIQVWESWKFKKRVINPFEMDPEVANRVNRASLKLLMQDEIKSCVPK